MVEPIKGEGIDSSLPRLSAYGGMGGNKREGETINAIGGIDLLFSSQLIIRIKQIKTSFLKILGANNLLQKSA